MKFSCSPEFKQYASKFKNRENVPLECPQCGVNFTKTKKRIQLALAPSQSHNVMFCSKQCANRSQISLISRRCSNCQKEIVHVKSREKDTKSGNMFCSRSCSVTFNNKLRPKRVKKIFHEKNCQHCGLIITIDRVRKTPSIKFCSNECQGKFRRSTNAHIIHDNNIQRALGRRFAFIIKKGGQCQKCGFNENASALVFHHIDPSNKKFKLSNGKIQFYSIKRVTEEVNKCILLCHNCHAELHNPKFQTFCESK